MQTTLTLWLDDALIRRARAWARAGGAPRPRRGPPAPRSCRPTRPGLRVGPWTRRLIGAAGPALGDLSDAEVRRRHRDHLERKDV
jgi:hypothetical protein